MADVCSVSSAFKLQGFSIVDISANSADSQMRQASAPVALIAPSVTLTNASMVALHSSKKVILTEGMLVLQVVLIISSHVARLS